MIKTIAFFVIIRYMALKYIVWCMHWLPLLTAVFALILFTLPLIPACHWAAYIVSLTEPVLVSLSESRRLRTFIVWILRTSLFDEFKVEHIIVIGYFP